MITNHHLKLSLKILTLISFSIIFFSSIVIVNNSNYASGLQFDDNNNTSIEPLNILFNNSIKMPSTGFNSTNTRISYNPNDQMVSISWIDQYQPFTPSEISSLYYVQGNKTEGWGGLISLGSFFDTLDSGYYPMADDNNDIHVIYEEFSIDNYDLSDSIDGLPIVTNAGNSTNPVTITDSENIIHLVWRDTTDNANGDLYYSYYNTTSGLWNSTTRITVGAKIVGNSLPALTLDYNNTLHLIWADRRTGDQELYYSYLNSGSSWSIEEKITNVPYAPINPRISFDNLTSKIQMIFKDNGTTNNLYYTQGDIKGTAANWSTPTVRNSYLAVGANYDICTDYNGNILIVYEQYANDRNNIYLQQKNAELDWSVPQLVSEALKRAHDPSITVDDKGNFYITYAQVYQAGTTEIYVRYGTLDSDEDGLSDLDEINIYNSDPNDPDTDGDTIFDGDEVNIYNTDPTNADSDSDLMTDDFEITYGLNPTNATDATQDKDEDGLTNLEEFNAGTYPNNPDCDNDELTDYQEVIVYGTNPLKYDTDGDSLSDYFEVYWGMDPLVWDDISLDVDGDGLSTQFEAQIGTNPLDSDTDDDGYSDGLEYTYNTDPLDPNDYPIFVTPKDYTNIIIAVGVSAGGAVIFGTLAILIARQFRPKESRKRKQLEIDERELYADQTEKGRQMIFEKQEKRTLEAVAKKTKGMTQASMTGKVDESPEIITDVTRKGDPKKLEKEAKVRKETLQKKRDQLRQAIITLQNYENQLNEMLKKKMTQFTLSTCTRELLTEFATESQTIYSEANTLWTATILPLIKGFEEELHRDTLDAEKHLDNCSSLSQKILDILVERELELTEEEVHKEDVKKLAHKVIEEQENKNDKKDDNES
ncbi:MAG: hypothetical protein FK734_11615 [Asgard group archaeon]|nr:hypothetical protein [Asgard group archaeon]